MFCIFGFKVWDRKLSAKYWHAQLSVFVHLRNFLVLVVNIGPDFLRYVLSSMQDLIVIETEVLFGKNHVFPAEDWLRPPLEL